MQARIQTSALTIPSRQEIGKQAAQVLLGTLALTASSWLSIPMLPVPITMQTYAVIVIGALLGPGLGALTVIAWLGESMLGLPVLAHGTGGILPFLGPTAGYLFSFPVVAAFVGWLAERGWTRSGLVRSFSAMLAGNAINLAMGATWLAAILGWHRAIVVGVAPFVTGAVVKAFLATSTIALIHKTRPRPTDAQ
jgi:biotin transport system substrate-specific component